MTVPQEAAKGQYLSVESEAAWHITVAMRTFHLYPGYGKLGGFFPGPAPHGMRDQAEPPKM